eukprot:SAG11_NODE_1566_length_4673_cov_3.640796_2_plen_62_part_00
MVSKRLVVYWALVSVSIDIERARVVTAASASGTRFELDPSFEYLKGTTWHWNDWRGGTLQL